MNILITLILCLFFSVNTSAQVLEKKVTLQYKNISIEEALKDISSKYGVNFSYSNNVIPLKKKVSISVNEKPLSYALQELFKGTGVSYEGLGSHVVLKKEVKKAPVQESNVIKPSSGTENTHPADSTYEQELQEEEKSYLPEKPKEEKVKSREEVYASVDTTVYFEETEIEKVPFTDTLDKVALRKQYLAEKRKLRRRYYSKMDSLDRAENPGSKARLKDQFKNVSEKLKTKINTIKDSISTIQLRKADTLTTKDSSGVKENEAKKDSSGYLHAPAQITFVSPLGTNGTRSWRTVNNFSFNVLAGAAAGLEGFELGGLLNVEKDYVRGAQIAGLGNIAGGKVSGGQFSGLFNINGRYTQGVQFSGFMNVVADSTFATQFAGFMNVVSDDCQGVQFAGFTNVANGNMYGFQAAGFLNFAKDEVSGGQVAGFMNVAGDNVYGPQIAGFMNIAPDTLRGVQIAGFMNVANELKGSQIGFLNFADSVTGVQLGFLSFSRRGYRRLEIGGGESLFGTIAFKTGTSRFYNILAAGARPEGSELIWGYGYGFGSEFKLSQKFILNTDLLAYNIHKDGFQYDELNLLNQFRTTFGMLLGSKTSIFAGPVLNVMVSTHKDPESGIVGSSISPDWNFFNKTYEDKTNVTMWIGGQAGIRF